MKRLICNAPIDVMYFWLLWLGLYQGVNWASNAALFVTWWFIIVLALATSTSVMRKVLEQKGRRDAVFLVWDIATDIAAVIMLAGAEYFVTATIFACLLATTQQTKWEIDEQLAGAA